MAESLPPRSPAPFVVGVSRSGTTLLRMMLDSHPHLAIPAESRFLPGLIERIGARADPAVAADFLTSWERWSDFHLDADELRRRLLAFTTIDAGQTARCFFELYAEGQDKPRWGDKSPPYVNHIAAIHAILPEAVFVHLIRDGRAVCVSMMRRTHGMRRPKPIARRWVEEISNARAQGATLPAGSYVELRYEELASDPEAVLGGLCQRLELEWSPVMMEFHARAPGRLAEVSDIELASGERRMAKERMTQFQRLDSPVTDVRAGAWQRELDPADRRRFESIAGDLLSELGYPTQ